MFSEGASWENRFGLIFLSRGRLFLPRHAFDMAGSSPSHEIPHVLLVRSDESDKRGYRGEVMRRFNMRETIMTTTSRH